MSRTRNRFAALALAVVGAAFLTGCIFVADAERGKTPHIFVSSCKDDQGKVIRDCDQWRIAKIELIYRYSNGTRVTPALIEWLHRPRQRR
jgi:hypothetical protein